MRKIEDIDKRVMWTHNHITESIGAKGALMELPTGVRCSLVVGWNEGGWEHVSIELFARRLPTWDEMNLIKDIFWEDEEEVVQIHPKKSHYVNLTEALHLWRPVNGDWSKLNEEE